MEQTVTASAPGRICLAGEHIDWATTGPVVLATIDIRTFAQITPLQSTDNKLILETKGSFNDQLHLAIDHLGQYTGHVLDYVHAAVRVAQKEGAHITPFKLSISSQLPSQAGVSSSSAVSLATLAALNKYYHLDFSTEKMCSLAYDIERNELNAGTGQMDMYSCGMGGLMYLDNGNIPPHPILQYQFPDSFRIILIDTLTPRSTAHIVAKTRERFENKEHAMMQYLENTTLVITRMHEVLKTPEFNTKDLTDLISEGYLVMKKYLKTTTPLIEQTIERCLELGCLTAKMTGLGMGGCVFAICPSEKVHEIAHQLSELPVAILETRIINEGIKYHSAL